MTKIYVLYHADCTDGLGSKYAAWKKFGDTAEYIPVQYKQPLPDIEDGSEVYILDFSYSKDELLALNKRVSILKVLDHHKTAEEALKNLDFAFFDMKKSGAVLSWEYFHPGVPVPDLLLHIQDRDIWTWKKPGTREVLNALKTLKEDFLKWDGLAAQPISPEFKDKWKLISDYEDNYVESKCKTARLAYVFFGHMEYKVALFNTTLLVSEIGSKLCKDEDIDFAIGYFVTPEGKVLLSLRSVGDFDVSPLAVSLGGGGHKNASGAIVSLEYLSDLYSVT
jgi:oligoribonuclease NrnB/cAMP/cGMP phosphodiesterase (DHH superfamily)